MLYKNKFVLHENWRITIPSRILLDQAPSIDVFERFEQPVKEQQQFARWVAYDMYDF